MADMRFYCLTGTQSIFSKHQYNHDDFNEWPRVVIRPSWVDDETGTFQAIEFRDRSVKPAEGEDRHTQ